MSIATDVIDSLIMLLYKYKYSNRCYRQYYLASSCLYINMSIATNLEEREKGVTKTLTSPLLWLVP